LRRSAPLTLTFELSEDRENDCSQITVKCGKMKVGFLLFTIYPTRIVVTDLEVGRRHQRRGYGRMMIRVLQAYASELHVPIELLSVRTSMVFYKKCGFKHNPKCPREKQELVWTPRRRKRKP